MTLRRFVTIALTAGMAATLVAADPAVASAAPVQLTLPAPTGPAPLGTVSLHLVQAGRPDPWLPGRTRELMVSLTYPARHADRYPTAPYMEAGAWESFRQSVARLGSVLVPQTAAHEGAPVDRGPGGLPVILYSPPSGGDRSFNTVLVQELAGRGYLVATVDHTYSDDEVEFPDGRVARRVFPEELTVPQLTAEVAERAKDMRFVLDELTAITRGVNPDAEHRAPPDGLRAAMNLNEVGMLGMSLGGATTAATMLADPRIKAGANLDGTLFGPVVTAGLKRPFLLLGAADHDNDPSWTGFRNASTGWKREFRLLGSTHGSYFDGEVLFPQLAGVLRLTPEQLKALIGTIDPARAITIESTYVEAFFDRQLRHRPGHLLDGPSPRFPEMVFVP